MLEGLKQSIRNNEIDKIIIEANIDHSSDDDVKDAFLDDPDTDIMGAEDDPEIADLIEKIPEYDDTEEIDIDKLEENFIPETNL